MKRNPATRRTVSLIFLPHIRRMSDLERKERLGVKQWKLDRKWNMCPVHLKNPKCKEADVSWLLSAFVSINVANIYCYLLSPEGLALEVLQTLRPIWSHSGVQRSYSFLQFLIYAFASVGLSSSYVTNPQTNSRANVVLGFLE